MVPFLRVNLNSCISCIGSLVGPVTSPSLNVDKLTAKSVVVGECIYVSFWLKKRSPKKPEGIWLFHPPLFFFLIAMEKK